MGVAERYRPISSAMEITGKFTAQCHGAEDVRDARLDCGMGVDKSSQAAGCGFCGRRGRLPLTNGWFALLSGLAACPLTPWLLKKYAGIPLSGRVRIAAPAFFFVAGRIALRVGI